MPRKLSPEEATVMIIKRRLQQMEEDKMSRQQGSRRSEPSPGRRDPDKDDAK